MTSLQIEFDFLKMKSFSHLDVTSKPAALILGMAKSSDKTTKHAVPNHYLKAHKELSGLIRKIEESKALDGSFGSVVPFLFQNLFEAGKTHPHVFAVGVGDHKNCHAKAILSLGAKVAKLIKEHKLELVDIYIDSLYHAPQSTQAKDAPKDFAGRPLLVGTPNFEEFFEKFALGMQLALYEFTKYKTSKNDDTKKSKGPRFKVRFLSSHWDAKKAEGILKHVEILTESVFITRDLQTTPGGDLRPADLARAAQDVGRKAGFRVEVWDEKKLKTENMGGIIAVGKGSSAQPRFVIMEHKGTGSAKGPTLVLIGKGVTFDTGGISIKPAGGMEEMKYDMSGAASVIGAMNAIARLKVPYKVYGLVPTAENSPSGEATRPGDIYTARGGKTVEVINTDAEGRLILADALEYAKGLNPSCVIDVATLTGAVTIALGAQATGIMGNNHKLIHGFQRASDKAGERTWELPLFEEYAEGLKSGIADIKNVSSAREAGSSIGGMFLNFFVENAYPWIHLDIAATADTPKGQGDHCPAHVGTGVPVRSLVEFAQNLPKYF